MNPNDKPLVWLHGEITTPPFSEKARIEAGYLLRQLQRGVKLSCAAIEADDIDWHKMS